jgi:hypothetical protein
MIIIIFALLLFIFLYLQLVTNSTTIQGSIMVKDDPKFITLFTQEIQNRAFAFEAVKQYVKERTDKPDKEFWAVYFALEQLNQKKYHTVTKTFGISQEATYVTKSKIWLVNTVAPIFPKIIVNTIKDASIAHVIKLEELEKLARSEHNVFFRYVVLQEKIQAQALVLLTEGKVNKATNIIENFVVQYSQ